MVQVLGCALIEITYFFPDVLIFPLFYLILVNDMGRGEEN